MSQTVLSKTAVGKPISCYKTTEKEPIVLYFYKEEPEQWHRLVHKRGGTIVQNVKDTLDSISDISQMYVVKVGQETAAFFVKWEKNGELYLEGFHIKKDFRSREFVQQFWEMVKEIFKYEFTTGICTKNEPAIRHLLRQGFVVIDKKFLSDNTFLVLKLNF